MNCIKILLQYCANINIQNAFYSTPLIIACEYGYTECVKILIKFNVNIDMQNVVDVCKSLLLQNK